MPSFYETYSKRTAENDAVGLRDLQQASSLMQLQQAVQAQREQQEASSIMQQGNGNLEAVMQGALRAGRPDIAAKLAPLIEAQKKASAPRVLPPGSQLLGPDNKVVHTVPFKPEEPKAPVVSDIGKLIAERDALPPGHPNRAAYDAAIKLKTERTPAAEKTYPIVHTADGIYERRPEGLVLLKDAKGAPLKANARERPITEYQGKNALYGSRATQADAALLALEDKISTVGLATKQSLQGVPVVGGILGAGANVALSANQQRVEQAQRNFVNAVLRQESGAVISDQEFENARKQYFPQPGDKPEVIAQKRQNRKTAIEGFKRIAGPAWPDAPASPGGWSITPVE